MTRPPHADRPSSRPGTAPPGAGLPWAVQPVRVSVDWLALREPADAAARAPDLVEEVRAMMPASARSVICDLGCGTGSMARWLAPRLPGEQHWIMYDRDPDLLAVAAAGMSTGGGLTVETRQRDITRLRPDELDGASLITASALLDMLTADELDRFVASCSAPGCPVLVTLSVIGGVEFTPVDPLDEVIADGFNAHQRRTTGGRRLLGPDAVGLAREAFHRRGIDVHVRPSPWRLGADRAALAGEWFAGWVAAACEERPELIGRATPYARRRLADAAAGRLGVTVQHVDLLARCG